MSLAFHARGLFDGVHLHGASYLSVADGRITGYGAKPDPQAQIIELGDVILSPAFVDLQVNGGGGVMIGDGLTLSDLERIIAAHEAQGVLRFLPTLITDTPAVTRHVIDLLAWACRSGRYPALMGLHLEGPHLAGARAGAHRPDLIRPIEAEDMALYLDAAKRLPCLKITLAPDFVPQAQIKQLVAAGIHIALGHSACTADQARAAADAGARIVTHLFNAMSQITAREPGLVGAALSDPRLTAGLIADLVHVHPDTLRLALAAKGAGLFLVSDAMAPAGTSARDFLLNGRQITRAKGQLRLIDGTLAGADLSLAQAVANLISLGHDPARALAMASDIPARVMGQGARLETGAPADFIALSRDWRLRGVWRGGAALTQS